jgi:hypothetical protein
MAAAAGPGAAAPTGRADDRGEEGRMAEIGEMAPDFAVKGTKGDEVRLSGFRWRKRVLLVFYPGDNTPG